MAHGLLDRSLGSRSIGGRVEHFEYQEKTHQSMQRLGEAACDRTLVATNQSDIGTHCLQGKGLEVNYVGGFQLSLLKVTSYWLELAHVQRYTCPLPKHQISMVQGF